MPAINASANLTLQVVNGPSLTYAWMITADAMDRVTLLVKAGANATADLQPAAGNSVLFVGITSTDYSGKVTYDTLFGGNWPITGPQLVAGSSLVNQLNNNPNSIKINNTGGGAINGTRVIDSSRLQASLFRNSAVTGVECGGAEG